ncbi:MAG: 30S ribosomal protein S9 [bacterium]|nr:30S ribosomal protein S9 [bacterium]
MAEKITKVAKVKKVEKVSKPSPVKVKTDRYFEAVGRRKTAIARVRLYNRAGGVLVNEKDYLKYFPTARLQQMAFSPLEKTKLNGKADVTVRVSGGGMSSQAEAVRHGLSRALVLFDANLKALIKGLGYLKRDPRMVERKKFGLKKARRAPQWAKR